MKALKVKDLLKLCEEQVKLGNGDKTIMVPSDEEGNDYHYLWYDFTTIEEIEHIKYEGKIIEIPFTYVDERVASKENTIILG